MKSRGNDTIFIPKQKYSIRSVAQAAMSLVNLCVVTASHGFQKDSFLWYADDAMDFNLSAMGISTSKATGEWIINGTHLS